MVLASLRADSSAPTRSRYPPSPDDHAGGAGPRGRDTASSRRNRRRHMKSSSAKANANVAAAPAVPAPVPAPPTPMQRLFDTSREVFAASAPGIVPPPDVVVRLAAILSIYQGGAWKVRVELTEAYPYKSIYQN
ncbi:uncharacterized protein LOC125525681 [Triticum urartu]|uniref:uncharacterized protein LOC125525681 n=1 Tax=Triticum urartu TaxID=4572 RepID=UPI00204326F4|nr:uncharacterized protein LOC125525681 [Triticum urartu]